MTKITLHVLLSLLNHNMNRDEDGRPKTAVVCGTERGRISSQARRRAIRFSPHFRDCQRSTRTRNAGTKTFKALRDAGLNDTASLIHVAQTVNYNLGSGGTKPTLKKASQDLKSITEKATSAFDKLLADGGISKSEREIFIQNEVDSEVKKILQSPNGLVVSTREFSNLDHLIAEVALGPVEGAAGIEAAKKMASYIDRNGLLTHDDRDEDVSLFGRMVAADAAFNVDAACAVSHAITTHSFAAEGDYWSAGEELPEIGETGAAITDYAFFGGGIYYQTVVLDLNLLSVNLRDDRERVRRAVASLFDGVVFALPGGKRNSHAPDHPAPYVLAVCGESPSVNYLTAFLKPVDAGNGRDGDLLLKSIDTLRTYHADIQKAYGFNDAALAFNGYPVGRKDNIAGEVQNLNELRDFVLASIPNTVGDLT